jgi:ABC-type transport system involved in multi-copper enzyme maturation permease subunit
MGRQASRGWGVGPVFVYEWLTSSRRWQGYALRAGFLLMMLSALLVIWNTNRPVGSPIQVMATLGEWFYVGVVGMQITLVLLAAPAATAGAICLDRARGTLTHMLVTDLSNCEIVLGKLAARLVPVLALCAATLPMMEILALVGGVDPNALLGAFVVTVGVAFLGCGLALLFSLWVGKTHEALICTYGVWGLWLLWRPIFGIIRDLFPGAFLPPPFWVDPYRLAFAPYWTPRLVAWDDYTWFLGLTSGIALGCALVAVLRVRAIVTRDVVKREPSRSILTRLQARLAFRRYLPARLMDWNPVLWHEWHRDRPSRWAWAVTAVYFAIAAFFSLSVVVVQSPTAAAFINGFQVFAGLLLLSVTASASLAEERARGSLDLMMTTSLSTRQIVLGKWLGTYRAVPLLAVLPAVVVAGLTFDRPYGWIDVLRIVVYMACAGAAVTSLGLAIATWVTRVGRAVAASVSTYVALAAGWFFVVLLISRGPSHGDGLMMGSPFAWALMVTWRAGEPFRAPPVIAVWATIWTVFLLAGAVALLVATLISFDRQLGRAEGPILRLMHGNLTPRERFLRLSFLAVAIIAAVIAMLSDPGDGVGFAINGTLVSVGLLVAAVGAALSCGRLLDPAGPAPPLWAGQSNLRIVLATWLGSLRVVAVVAMLGWSAVLGRLDDGPNILVRSLLILTYVAVVGAAWCGLAVALGASLARRASAGFTAAIYGVVVVFEALAGGSFLDSHTGNVAWLSNPFVAVATMTMEISRRRPAAFDVSWPLLVTIALHVAATVVLLAIATASVERRLGNQGLTTPGRAPAPAS